MNWQTKCAWCLPFQGVVYFLVHPSLWKEVMIPLAVLMWFSVFAWAGLLYFTFGIQQQHFESKGWSELTSWVFALLMVALEATLGTLLVFLGFFANLQPNITRDVLEIRGVPQRLLEEFGIVLPEQDCCRSVCHAMLFLGFRLLWMIWSLIIACIFSAPLLTIPGVGELQLYLLFDLLNGWLYAWELVTDFLAVINIVGCKDQGLHVWRHLSAYVTFGAVALGLELLPGVGPFFMISNACAGALLFEGLLALHTMDDFVLLNEKCDNEGIGNNRNG